MPIALRSRKKIFFHRFQLHVFDHTYTCATAMMPESSDLAVFVLMMTDKTDYFTPCACSTIIIWYSKLAGCNVYVYECVCNCVEAKIYLSATG